MTRVMTLAACLAAVTFIALACVSGESGEPVATHTPVASPTPDLFALPGFDIELAPETTTKVSIDGVPAVFEEHPDVVVAELSQTLEGQMSHPASVCEDTRLVRRVSARLIGNWVSFAILNDAGECVATRQGYPRDSMHGLGLGLPAALALEATFVAWAGAVTIVGPIESFASMGITYYPPEVVEVRGVNGVYLREEGTGSSEALPVHRLIWIEDGIYWHLIGMDEQATGDPGLYNLEELLRLAEMLPDAAPRIGIPELDTVLGALFSGDEEAIRALVTFTPVACETKPVGLGAPPTCSPDEPEGTLVDVFPHAYCEGVYIRPEDMAGRYPVLANTGAELYAMYEAPESYWPPGEYVVIYTTEAGPTARAVSIKDGRIIGSHSGCAGTPEEFIATHKLEDILVGPFQP